MATVEELLRAADRADKAGDVAAARDLVRAAKQMMGAASMPGPMTPPAAETMPNGSFSVGRPTAPQRDRPFDTAMEMATPPMQAAGQFARGIMDPAQSPTYAALPEGTFGPSRRALGVMGDAAMAGINTLGAGIGLVAGAVGDMAGGNRTQERKLAGDLVGMAQVAVPELAGVSSTARVAGAAAKAPRAATAAEQTALAARDLGITPALGALGKTAAMTAAGLEKIPFAGSVIAKDAERFLDQMQTAFKAIRGRIGSAMTSYEAGARLQAGVEAYRTRFDAKADKFYDAVSRYLPPQTNVQPTNTLQAIADSKAAFANNPELAAKLGLNGWDDVAREAQANGIPWLAVRKFRSSIGEAISRQSDVLGSDDLATLKQLYAALSRDMEATAQAAGPQALAAWQWANQFYAKGASRIEDALKGTLNAKSPEAAFEAFSAMARADRSSADARRMLEIKASLKPGEWRDVSASIVDRLGRANPGAQGADADTFSAATFLTKWNSMSPEAKRVLLPEDVRVEMDKLAQVAESAKSAGLERNTSNTANAENIAKTAIGLTVAPVLTVSTLAGANLTARALTSVEFLRAVNTARAGRAQGLQAMARGAGPFAADAAEVLRLMGAEAAATAPANDQTPIRAVR